MHPQRPRVPAALPAAARTGYDRLSARARLLADRIAPWLAAAVLLVLGLSSVVMRYVRRGASALADAAARAAPHVRRALRSAVLWIVWAVLVGAEHAARAVRAGLAALRTDVLPRLDALDGTAGDRLASLGNAAGEAIDRLAHRSRTRLRTGVPIARARLGELGRAGAGGAGTAARAAAHASRAATVTAAQSTRAAARRVDAAGLGRRFELRRRFGLAGSSLLATLATAVTTLGLVAALGVPAVQLAASSVTVEVDEPEPLPPLAERSAIRAADGSTLVILHGPENRRIVPLDDVPEHVRAAVITAEDRRFYDHEGFDPVALGRALGANLEATAVVQGGSTITQQLAKLNFVGDSRSLDRKGLELIHAVGLEGAFEKDTLLERYLNQVYFGSGAYGIAAAAEEYFRATPEELSPAQAALLAAQIRAPNAVDLRAEPETAKVQRDRVLAQMVADGHHTVEEGEAARNEPVEVEPPVDREPTEPYVVEAVKREFLANPVFGETREERVEALFTGGLEIETTLDPEVQAHADDTVREHVDAFGGPSAALAAIEPGDGRVVAVATGGDFEESNFDLATQGRRQPGSAFKTFALIAALEAGVDPDQSLDGDGPAEHDLANGQEWEVHNFGGARHGTVTLEQAVAQSVNTAFAELTLDVGHDAVIDVATRLGIGERAFGEANTHGPAIALGGLTHGVSPLELAAAYAALAADGRYAAPYLIERVVDPDGEPRYEHIPEPEQALEPDVAAASRDLLEEVVENGTGTAAQLADWPVAGKTGTSQSSADAWFVGTTPRLSTAVWVGHPHERTPVQGLTGGGMAAPLWHDFTADALADVPPEPFPG